ncbi:MAG: hypothetical protein AAF609_11240 [Cyanobacteria bacterium P01_C01_bin.120]
MKKKVVQISTLLSIAVVIGGGFSRLATRASTVSVERDTFFSSTVETLAQTRITPPVPPLPASIPTPRIPDVEGIIGLIPTPEDDIGVGHLRPRDTSFLNSSDSAANSLLGAGWLQSAAIPIYIEPNGMHWGWIINGWLVPNSQTPIALGQDASFSMLQAYTALSSFPVMQIREDGWFEFQYTPAGRAWAHVDHLNLGSLDLAVELWESHFVGTGEVEFRRHGLSQALYGAPASTQTNVLGLVGPESQIQPIAFEGDWMRVQVTQPTAGCTPLPGAVIREGWMRWRSDEAQPLVWITAEGC